MSKSDEESVEEEGEPVSKVLNDIDPELLPFLTNSILSFSGCKPRGHPSFYHQINRSKKKITERFRQSTNFI